MIATLRGAVVEKDLDRAVIEAAGVGYEVVINASTSARLPEAGGQTQLHVSQTVGLYGGGTTLYGFLTREE
ncbi:MAG: OB-fold domain-containing protein, partial [candidate division NC10 bacterium]